MSSLHAAISAGFLAAAFVGVAPAVDDADEERTFVDWARRSAVSLKASRAGSGFEDLEPLGAAVGDADVVSLGEATHGTREVFQMKHRLLEFLVERKGFNVFAIEGSPGGCAAIDAYLHGAEGDPAELLRGVGYWTWDTEEVLALIRWMRAYNDDARHPRKVAFHGFDMQSPDESFQHVLDYLEPLDPALARRIGTELEPYRVQLYWLFYRPFPATMREAVDRAMGDLRRRLDEGRNELVARSSRKAWEFARRQLVVVEQADEQGRGAMKYQPAMGSVAYRRLVDSLPKTAASLAAALAANDPTAPQPIKDFLVRLGDEAAPFLKGYRESRKVDDPSRRWESLAKILVERLDSERAGWIERSSASEWEKARREADDMTVAVEAAGQITDLPKDRPNVRDRCMAENAAWLLDREGPDAKVVAWAHNWHVMKPAAAQGHGRMGTNLELLLGERHFVIGFAFNRGGFQARGLDQGKPGTSNLQPFSVGPAKAGSVDRALSEVGLPLFALDLRGLRRGGPESTWPTGPRPLRDVPAGFEPPDESTYYIPVNLPHDFDAIVFMEETTRARPNPSPLVKLGPACSSTGDLNLGFESTDPEGSPVGWSASGSLRDAAVTLDGVTARVGCRSLRIERSKRGAATNVLRSLPAGALAGRRLTIHAQARTERITRGYAGLVVRVESPGEILAMDDSASKVEEKFRLTPDFRGILGTNDWKPATVEILVPTKASTVRFGALHTGDGVAWFD
jgi:erythromycin esterase-like protein